MKLQQKIELIHRSSSRMMILGGSLAKGDSWWQALRREVWLHLRRTVELLWMVLRRKQ